MLFLFRYFGKWTEDVTNEAEKKYARNSQNANHCAIWQQSLSFPSSVCWVRATEPNKKEKTNKKTEEKRFIETKFLYTKKQEDTLMFIRKTSHH